ncbi:dihydrofolate reductase [Runella sp. CRIBMP]|uniref:dihydrofolate reductase n=1 Tax=Runella sp. CRIBMP TaxID=2683261 RepID=UPI0014135B07|nr:dihydrofolate reductase [Runella sp. CRIBMP]NBB18351.1 dihydrofolate reductase [Runella sp. CRIBMP]
MLISLIVAAAQNGVIGRDNQLIWHLPDDLKQFKRLTTGYPIIMGRKTFDSIGKPLPNRTSIVITRNQDWQFEGVIVVNSVNKAIEAARQTGTDEAFVIGGAEVYKMTLPVADKIYLTEVKAEFEGDAYFTIPNKEKWQEISRVSHATDEKHAIAFDFVELVRQG